MGKNLLAVLVIIAALGVGLYVMTNRTSNTPSSVTPTTAPTMAAAQTSPAPSTSSAMMEEKNAMTNVKEFTVEGGNFSFTPNMLTVKKGDTVKITFKNLEGIHDFKLDEFTVATKQIPAGSEETVEFVADKTGSFEYYCSVGKHRQMGMKGTLVVQ